MTTLNIAFASDENYVPYMSIALISLLENNSDNFGKINVHILDSGITQDSKEQLIKITYTYNCEISFIEINDIESRIGLKIHSNMSLSTYSRLFLPLLLPEDMEKIIYLDSDSIVEGSFKELWDMNIDNFSTSGVLDIVPKYYRESIGLNENDNYINAGFLLINLKKWRDNNIGAKFIDFIKKYNGKVPHNDQGIINGVLKDSILIINPKYNMLSIFYEIEYNKLIKLFKLKNYYDGEIVLNDMKNPVFIHLAPGFYGRPWITKSKHPLKSRYEYYADLSPWKDFIFIEDNRKLSVKMLSNIAMFLPFFIFCRLFHIYSKYM